MVKMCFAKSLMSNNKLFQGHPVFLDTGKAVTKQGEAAQCDRDSHGSS